MTETVLRARKLTVRYGAFLAVDSVDLDVVPGSVHAIIGPNGAGKTTLFNALSGLVGISSGQIELRGERIDGLPVSKRLQRGLSRSFQVTNLFFDLTVHENMRLALQGKSGLGAFNFVTQCSSQASLVEGAHHLLERFSLEHKARSFAGELSHGEQRRLEIGLALASNPSVLFLDEPTAGMGSEDIDFTKRFLSGLVEAGGLTIVLIEHNMSLVMDISDTITVLQQGQKIAEGSADVIRADAAVRAAYLGE
ncbi:ABC transporter ATP-binding protein [Pollutimonas thiosulfatoxidans]|uniref:ABC transporter domain-containing protein n=1 Tax=Pollutimonas thiosulfatoxidans TaxID=2028345 RepID=A0A410GER2_9BURK|nr:ABC transporter ATP-binding protein [Pollutimonas thiosulfatoxidans]QAA94745.1 hypothetical protein CKA81_13495 [Pollutimonas thiosulfatoxidans]